VVEGPVESRCEHEHIAAGNRRPGDGGGCGRLLDRNQRDDE
jgi:hypothetical protein